MYKVIKAISVDVLQEKVNNELENGFIPIGGIAIRNIGKAFKTENEITEIEYYQPLWNPETNDKVLINIFNKSNILNFK